MSKRGNKLERSIVTEYSGPVKGPIEIEQSILFFRKVGAPLGDRRETLNIAHQLNKTLSSAKVPTDIPFHWLNYNENSNLSGLMALPSTSSMLPLQHWGLVLKAVRHLDQDITDVTGIQWWHKVRAHEVDHTRYR